MVRTSAIVWAVLLSSPFSPYCRSACFAQSIPQSSSGSNKNKKNDDDSGIPSLGSTATEEDLPFVAATTLQDTPERLPPVLSETKCRWGEHCPDSAQSLQSTNGNANTNTNINNSQWDPAAFLKTPLTHVLPPEGFVITARVYTDPDDKLAHFDHRSITLPYWECGVVGSSTSPLSIKHAYFRHVLSKPNLWSGAEYGPHPQLLVALVPLEISLNSGEQQTFQPGHVVLLEDVMSPGHKLQALSHHDSMTVLVLTLPQHYHHVGKDRVSLTSTTSTLLHRPDDPCPVQSTDRFRERTRKLLLASLGMTLSSLTAVFLGKVAPLWLSVGVGGMCFITGGTYAVVQCGEFVIQEAEMWNERRRLVLKDVTAEDTQNIDIETDESFRSEAVMAS